MNVIIEGLFKANRYQISDICFIRYPDELSKRIEIYAFLSMNYLIVLRHEINSARKYV